MTKLSRFTNEKKVQYRIYLAVANIYFSRIYIYVCVILLYKELLTIAAAKFKCNVRNYFFSQ